jgi:mono/diheme cytochrome c family protein
MNTSKQVNAMIGLLFIAFLFFGGYIAREQLRAEEASIHQNEELVHRGAELFHNNCVSCHGLVGEGNIGPALNSDFFRTTDSTPDGEAREVYTYLFNTLSCGRSGAYMPLWSERFGGSMSETQIDYLVKLIMQGRWDLVEHANEEHFEHRLDSWEIQKADAERRASTIPDRPELTDYLTSLEDSANLAITADNCGQYSMDTRSKIYARTPFSADAASVEASQSTAESAATEAPPGVLAVELAKDGPYAITAPDTFSADGEISLQVKNNAALIHNLRLLRTDISADSLPTNDQGMVDVESAGEVLFASDDLQNGGEEETNLSLDAGTYVLFCDIPGHYQLRMYKAITIE